MQPLLGWDGPCDDFPLVGLLLNDIISVGLLTASHLKFYHNLAKDYSIISGYELKNKQNKQTKKNDNFEHTTNPFTLQNWFRKR